MQSTLLNLHPNSQMCKQLPVLFLFFLSSLGYAQTPGGITLGPTEMTSWIDVSAGTYQDAAKTTLATNASTVSLLENQVSSAVGDLSAANHGASTAVPTFNSEDEDFNFNPSVSINSGAYFYATGLAYNDVFSSTNGFTYYIVFQAGKDMAFTLTSNLATSPCGSSRCCTGPRFSSVMTSGRGSTWADNFNVQHGNLVSGFSNFAGTTSHSVNGLEQVPTSTSFQEYSGALYNLSLFYFPGYTTNGRFAELITINRMLTATERNQVESYLAVKYGITLGGNGTGEDYLNSDGNVVWEQSSNAGFAYDIFGIARDDASGLMQLKSQSVNETAGVANDILTIASAKSGGTIDAPGALIVDKSYLLCGHNNGALENTSGSLSLATENGEIIESQMDRTWKIEEFGSIDLVGLRFDMSSIISHAGAGNNDLQHLRLLIDEDGDFSSGATSVSPTAFDNATGIVDFYHNFRTGSGAGRGAFFAIASVDAAAASLPVDLTDLRLNCQQGQVALTWETEREENNAYFSLLKSVDGREFTEIARLEGQGTTLQGQRYTYVDQDIHTGTVYYQLEQVDFDGRSKKYAVKSILCEQEGGVMELYPNPVKEQFTIRTKANANIILRNVQGQEVFRQQLSQGQHTIDMRSELSGLYFLTVQLESGEQQTYKVLKN